MSITADDPFLGVSRVSRAAFIGVLLERPANADCLAERDPGAYWDECRAWGVDPCFALAMFTHESSMGTAGTAMETRSWGNTRSPSFGAVHVDKVAGRSGTFPVFASWLDGCASTAGRLASPVWPTGAPYGERASIREVFDHPSGAVWAPAGDMNDPDGYLNAMLALMNDYADQPLELIPGPFRAPAPAVYSHYLTINYTRGRPGSVTAVILHVTQGDSAEGCLNWFANPASQVSAHYVIDRDGTIYCAVRERDTAWANGVLNRPNTTIPVVARWVEEGINPNVETVSIECAGYSSAQPSGDPALDGYSEAQFVSLAFLLPALGGRHALWLDGSDLFGHREIDGVNRADCPGLSVAEWEHVYMMGANAAGGGPYATPDEAFDAYLRENGETAVWAGQVTGRGHWFARDPQEIVRTDADALLGYDGAYAADATGLALDDWQSVTKASGQLIIWGEEPAEPPEPPPVGAAWPIHPGDGLTDVPVDGSLMWGRDAPTADVRVYNAAGLELIRLDAETATTAAVTLPPGDLEWAVRGREGTRVSDWTMARFAVVGPEPEEPPDPPSTEPYPPVVAPTYQDDATAASWRNVHDNLIDLAVSRKWRPDCDGGAGPWPDTDQWLNSDFPGAHMAGSPHEIRALTRRLSIHPPIVEAGWRLFLWDRVPAEFTVNGSEWEDDALTDYGDDWSDMPAYAQAWASQLCTLATAIQRRPTLADAFGALGFNQADADAWSNSYHCLRRRVRDLQELSSC
jgi:N-acetyl-anhydromuramyl-L-alanine amidase AmpD